jgi:MoCo/4Fe-4S cofactor protein with predicted Tat translocation signal
MREGTQGTRSTRGLGSGPMWRSLDELAGSARFQEALDREFPESVHDFDASETTRRNFLRLMGASMALAGLYGCSERPSGKIIPYVQQPEQIVPGMPLYFATAMPMNGYGYGVIAESHEGRPTKVEGNPDHPASLGGTNIFMQASALQLYDPDEFRAKNVLRAGDIASWEAFRAELQERLDLRREEKDPAKRDFHEGKGVRLLTGTITSPTLAAQVQKFLKEFPQARWHHYEPVARDNTTQGAVLAFGKPVNPVYRFRQPGPKADGPPADAKVIVSLDSDFLWADPGSLQYARHFAAARKVRVRNWWQTTMSRLYVVESNFTLTGSMADHRIPAPPHDVAHFARALAAQLGVERSARDIPITWGKALDAIVADLQANRGQSIVIVGESQPPEIHRLGHLINAALGNVGKTVYYTDPVEFSPQGTGRPTTSIDSLRQLTDDINANQVDTLLILGDNPVYNAPYDLHFGDALFRLSHPQASSSGKYENFTAYLGLYSDETAYFCQWQLPQAHYLESWGDVRAFDGTASVIQPLIAPMRQGRAAIEVMEMALSPRANFAVRTGYEIVRGHWQGKVKGDFDHWWAKSLEKGVIADTKLPAIQVAPEPGGGGGASAETDGESPASRATTGPATTRPAGPLQVIFRPDPSVWDGAFANNGWLQECPKFFTKLVWDNAAAMSPKTAKSRLPDFSDTTGDGQVYRFTAPDGRWIEVPVLQLPGLADDVVVMTFGYGRARGGAATIEADGKTPRGVNTYAFRPSHAPWCVHGITAERTGRFHELVVTHNHYAMDALPGFGREDERGRLKPEVVEHPGMDEQTLDTSNRKLIRTTTLDYFNAAPEHRHFVKELGSEAEKKPLLSLYPGWDYSKGYQWGMSIDMQSCIGCNACLVACVAENNIPVVGRDEVARQREMHWIRIDQYFADDLDNPKVYHQPVPCMQCENAPCEVVCPVGATVHSPEGINDMVYNRCVGTRYCQNNCPYKVRRFNFFNFFSGTPAAYDLQHNPQVTVRYRGVMEKCTYCIQRIQRTRIEIEKMIVRDEELIGKLKAERDAAPAEARADLDRRIDQLNRQKHNREFETLETLQTACQQACPTNAIVFGHILPVTVIDDKGQEQKRLTRVSKLKQEPLDYPLLAELTTKPRTTYMARLRNPNPTLEPDAKS